MTAIDTLLARASASRLRPPAPSGDALDRILGAALRAPDHGLLRPVRLLVIEGAGLERLADAGQAALAAREPQTDADGLRRAREKLLRAPMVLALAGRIDPAHRKIPEIEQILTVGAAGMNILAAVHAQGFAAKWVTGGNAHDPEFARALGFEPDERLFGLIMIGTVEG